MSDEEYDELTIEDFEMFVGDDEEWLLTSMNDENNSPRDVSSSVFRFTVYPSYADKAAGAPPLLEFASGNGLNMAGAVQGEVLLAPPGAAVAAAVQITDTTHPGVPIPRLRCPYEYVETLPDGTERVRMVGKFIFKQRLTARA